MSGGGSSPSGSTTTTQTSQPWSGQQPYLEQAFSAAQNLYNNNTPQYYPTSTVAPLNAEQTAGQNAEFNFGANGGNPAVGAATNYETALQNGAFLNPENNPAWQQVSNSVLSKTMPQLMSTFTQGNTMNSPGAAYAVSQGANDALGSIAGQNYQNTLGLMNTGAAFATPSLQNAQLQGISAMQDAGNQQQTQAQNELTDQVNRFNYNQMLPYNQLNAFEGAIQGNYGGTSTLNQPYYSNSMGNALSGALGGAMLGSQILPGVGTVGGGLLGALMMSDRRVKEGIAKIGKADNDLPIYSYRYKGDHVTRIGFMAQDVEKVKPEAVAHLPGGLMAVDYAKAVQ